ncbi:hypothetical protein LJR290_007590 [Variovorax sp. LjRoot290]|uniref:hypothetical protein n=1 Tax=Variovorax sp. LjRoot290 TaxID=3342316 RepID=UPI003ECE3685
MLISNRGESSGSIVPLLRRPGAAEIAESRERLRLHGAATVRTMRTIGAPGAGGELIRAVLPLLRKALGQAIRICTP